MKDEVNEFLNIPDRLLVGFQKRDDTFTGKLAYVTYHRKGGVIAKEISWNCWRDKTIEPSEFDNTPIDGFEINKSIERDSRWSSRSIFCRIYDPRGFEFEISVDNLLFILQTCEYDPVRGFRGKFVYAWNRQDLILLPIVSADYKASRKLIDESSLVKIGARDLVLGKAYKTKFSDTAYYIGKLDWKLRGYGTDGKDQVKISKYHSFLVKSSDPSLPDEVYRENNLGNILIEKEGISDISVAEVNTAVDKFKLTLAGNTGVATELRLDPVPQSCINNWASIAINRQMPATRYTYPDVQGVVQISSTEFKVYDLYAEEEKTVGATGRVVNTGKVILNISGATTISIDSRGIVNTTYNTIAYPRKKADDEFIKTLAPIQSNNYMKKTWSVKIGSIWYEAGDNMNGIYKQKNKIELK